MRGGRENGYFWPRPRYAACPECRCNGKDFLEEMRKTICGYSLRLMAGLFVGWLLVAGNVQAQRLSLVFDMTDRFLEQYTHHGPVDYAAVREKPDHLDELVKDLGKVRMTGWPTRQQQAFWINAHNLLVVHSIAGHDSLVAPSRRPGFFDQQRHWVAGDSLTLREIVEDKLRPLALRPDPRIYFALISGEQDGPPLRHEAYDPNRMALQLELQMRQLLNEPTFVRRSNGRVRVPEFFRTYAEDFRAVAPTLAAFLTRYSQQPVTQDTKIEFYPHDGKMP